MLRKKNGSEYVEAAIVLPMIVLIVVSFLGAATFCWRSLEMQCRVQAELLDRARESEALYDVCRGEGSFSLTPGGAFSGTLSGTYRAEMTVLDERRISEIGGWLRDAQEDG